MKLHHRYVGMERLFDGIDWDKLHLFFCEAIARSAMGYSGAGTGHPMYATQNLGHRMLSQLQKTLSPSEQAAWDRLGCSVKNSITFRQVITFSAFYFGHNVMPVVMVRSVNSMDTKHLATETFDTPNTIYFRGFLGLLKRLDLFEQIGRVIVFLSPVGYEARAHKDHPVPQEQTEEFIWLNPSARKRFYLMNREGERQYISDRAAWFDTSAYHGADHAALSTYTVRIDGVFSAKTRNYIQSVEGPTARQLDEYMTADVGLG